MCDCGYACLSVTGYPGVCLGICSVASICEMKLELFLGEEHGRELVLEVYARGMGCVLRCLRVISKRFCMCQWGIFWVSVWCDCRALVECLRGKCEGLRGAGGRYSFLEVPMGICRETGFGNFCGTACGQVSDETVLVPV